MSARLERTVDVSAVHHTSNLESPVVPGDVGEIIREIIREIIHVNVCLSELAMASSPSVVATFGSSFSRPD